MGTRPKRGSSTRVPELDRAREHDRVPEHDRARAADHPKGRLNNFLDLSSPSDGTATQDPARAAAAGVAAGGAAAAFLNNPASIQRPDRVDNRTDNRTDGIGNLVPIIVRTGSQTAPITAWDGIGNRTDNRMDGIGNRTGDRTGPS